MVCFWCFVLFVPAIFRPWPKAWVAEWVQSQHWTESHDLSRQAAGWSKKAKDGRIFFGFCGRFLRILYLSIIEHLHWVSGHDYEHDLRMASALGMLGSIDCNAGQPYLGWDTDEFPSDPRTWRSSNNQLSIFGIFYIIFSSFFQSRLSQFWIKILLHGGHGAGSACYLCWLWWSRAALHRVATTLTASYAARAPTLRSHRFSLMTGLESQLKTAKKHSQKW